jgi:hypothetical protein
MLHRKPENGAALQFSCVAGDVVRRMDLPIWGGRLSGRVNTAKLLVKLCKTLNKKPLIVAYGHPSFPRRKGQRPASIMTIVQLSSRLIPCRGKSPHFQIQRKCTSSAGDQKAASLSAAARSLSSVAAISR